MRIVRASDLSLLNSRPSAAAHSSLQPAAERYTQLLSLSTITTINAALCERHLVNCPPSEELQQQCSRVGALLGCVVLNEQGFDALP